LKIQWPGKIAFSQPLAVQLPSVPSKPAHPAAPANAWNQPAQSSMEQRKKGRALKVSFDIASLSASSCRQRTVILHKVYLSGHIRIWRPTWAIDYMRTGSVFRAVEGDWHPFPSKFSLLEMDFSWSQLFAWQIHSRTAIIDAAPIYYSYVALADTGKSLSRNFQSNGLC